MKTLSFYRRLFGVLVFAFSSWMVACVPPLDPLPNVAEGDRKVAVQSHTRFALALYEKLKSDKGNLFFSPYSISSALTMTYAGAKGETASEMRKVLQLQLKDEQLHAANGWLMININNRGKQGFFKLAVANRLWGQKNFGFLPAFLDVLKVHYLADLEELDFLGDAEGSRQTINKWVAQKTEDKIKELLPAGSITGETRLVLTNAIYFKADWAVTFKKEDTQKRAFFTSPTDSKQVDMMFQEKAKGSYADLGALKVLSLPYKGKELSMVIVLPKEKGGLAAIEGMLSEQKLEEWLGKLEAAEDIKLVLPKFEFKKKKRLNQTLRDMGMKLAFTSKADFTGMAGSDKPLLISDVLHEAYIKVDEEGTEAAAATAVVLRGTTSVEPQKSFVADHPFLFMIRDNTTGELLFMGRITDPSES